MSTVGNGTYVDVSDGNVDEMGAGFAGGRNILVEKYDQTFSLVQEKTAEVSAYLTTLGETLTSVALPEGWADAIGSVVIADVPGIDTNSISPPGEVTLPGFDAVTFPLLPFLAAAPAIDISYTAPTAPLPVNPTIGYMMSAYSSDMWLDLFTKVHTDLINGGTGLNAEVETAIHARNAERNRAANEKAYLAAIRALTGRRLSYPQIALRVIEQRMAGEILRQEHASSNEITIAQAELAQKNTHFIVDKSIDLEKVLRSFFETSENLSLNAKKAAADLVLQLYAEQNRAYISQWQAIAAEMKAKVDVVNAIVEQNRSVIEGFKAQTDGAIAQTEQISKARDSIVEAHKADVQIYASRVEAQASWYRALSENQKAQLAKSELELRRAVEGLRAFIDSNVSINSLKEKILEAMGSIAGNVAASALNAVHTGISHSTSAGESRSESWNFGATIHENHSTEHSETT